MATKIPTTDPIPSQFRISPDQIPKMSSSTMAPSYTSIRKFQLALEENAFAIQSHQTKLGHLALVIQPDAYLSANDNNFFVEPTDPGFIPPDPTEGISSHLQKTTSAFSRTPP